MPRSVRSSRGGPVGQDGASALDLAAADLEAVTGAYEECTRALEAAEATIDALLDETTAYVLVLDGDGRIRAMSRGMATLLGLTDAALGQAAERVTPPTWSGLSAADALRAADGWQSVPVDGGEGRLCLRRVTEDDRSAVVVVRFEHGELSTG